MSLEIKALLEDLEAFLLLLDKTETTEVKWEKGDWGISVCRKPFAQLTPLSAAKISHPTHEAQEIASRGTIQVFSPVVGVFHFPDTKPQKGGIIKDGNELGYVEAISMKHFVEIEGPGRLVEVHATEGQPVGFGDILFTLRNATSS